MALLEVISVSKAFMGVPVLRDVSFHVDAGEIVCLLGPSGCGKTTLLRIIAGLETADRGSVLFAGRALDDVPVHHRGFGLMFQDFALFPHKDVAANVAFGLRMRAIPREETDRRMAEMLALVGLAGYEQRQVYDLSGGEQQRVALARSLAPDPRLLMLDEPLGSLDRALREELMNELRVILKRVGVTAIYVTHDQQEAFAVSDRVGIMNWGRMVQQGAPQAVYRNPGSAWVAHFLGLSNLVPSRVVALEPLQIDTPLGLVTLTGTEMAPALGQQAVLLVRPESARLAVESSDEDGFMLEGCVQGISFRGSHYRLLVRTQQGLDLGFELITGGARLPQVGQRVQLLLGPEAFSLLPEETDESESAA